MHSDTTRAEADVIIAESYLCEPLEWNYHEDGQVWEMRAGLMDYAYQNVGLQVVLEISHRPRTGLHRIRMTMFKVHKSPQRVYQLELPGVKVLDCKHQQPHEHIGRDLLDGQPGWSAWDFDQALKHFKSRTNVTFDPELDNPYELNFFK